MLRANSSKPAAQECAVGIEAMTVDEKVRELRKMAASPRLCEEAGEELIEYADLLEECAKAVEQVEGADVMDACTTVAMAVQEAVGDTALAQPTGPDNRLYEPSNCISVTTHETPIDAERTTEQWREEFAMADPQERQATCEACGDPGRVMDFKSMDGKPFKVHLCDACFRLLPPGDAAISRMRSWRARYGFYSDEPLTKETKTKMEEPPPWTVWK